MSRGGEVYLGIFATAEEAALCVARSPDEKQAAAKRAAVVQTTPRNEVFGWMIITPLFFPLESGGEHEDAQERTSDDMTM